MSNKLTAQQKLFCQEYIVDLNAKQAAIRAGYSPKCAQEQGSRLLSYDKVNEAISILQAERVKRTEIDADWVLQQAKELHLRCMQDIAPVMVREGKEMVQAIDEEGRKVFKFNAGGAAKALELVGKHINIQAFNEKQSMDVSGNVVVYSGVPRAPDEESESD